MVIIDFVEGLLDVADKLFSCGYAINRRAIDLFYLLPVRLFLIEIAIFFIDAFPKIMEVFPVSFHCHFSRLPDHTDGRCDYKEK